MLVTATLTTTLYSAVASAPEVTGNYAIVDQARLGLEGQAEGRRKWHAPFRPPGPCRSVRRHP